MKTLIRSISIAAMAVFTALSIAQGNQATESGAAVKVNHVDSATISNLLVDARTHAKLAAANADLLVSTAREPSSAYQSFGVGLMELRENVNSLGKVKTQLLFLKDEGSPWQQIAISRIDLHVRTLADRVSETIQQYNPYPMRAHMPPFTRQLKANYEEANITAELIGDFVEYGKARANASSKIGMLENKLGLSPAYRDL
jgi:hypothetical protein